MYLCDTFLHFTKIIVTFCAVFFCATAPVAASANETGQGITLVGEDEWYPYAAFKDGKLQGLAVDVIEAAFAAVNVIEAAFAAVNVKVQFKSAPYARCLMLAESGQELACFDSLKDSKLRKKFLFHEVPIFRAEIGIYALESSPEKNVQVDALHGKQVGVTHGYTYTDKVDTAGWIIREVAPTDLSNLRKLIRQRSDYSLVYTRVVDYLLSRYPDEFLGKIKQVGSLSQNSLFVSFSRQRAESAKFAELLDQGLRKIKKSGEYAKIEQKWQRPLP